MSTQQTRAGGRPLSFGDPAHLAAHRFLVEEAHVLDQRDFEAWLAMLAPDVRYRVPVTSTAARGAPSGKPGGMDHYDEDLYSLKTRVDRFRTNFAWAEDPPSRTRHFVSNVCTFAGESANEVQVRSYLLLFRSRGDLRAPDFVSGMRDDVLRREGDDRLLLKRREVTLDESVLRTQNLAIFL
jgi:phthalate 3,4-dioxygenase beta subunit